MVLFIKSNDTVYVITLCYSRLSYFTYPGGMSNLNLYTWIPWGTAVSEKERILVSTLAYDNIATYNIELYYSMYK